MSRIGILWCLALLAPWSVLAAECESVVDMADSLDFHKMHVECDQEPQFQYDPSQREAVQQPSPDSAIKPSAALELEGSSVFTVEEPFTATGGPESAIRGLFAQLIERCPNGWVKHDEWVKRRQGVYALYYRARCDSSP